MKWMRGRIVVITLATLAVVSMALLLSLPTGRQIPAPGGPILIEHVRVLGAEGFGDLVNVLVDDGRIAAIGAAPGQAQETIDGRGGLLLPGLIDAHTHSWGNALEDTLRFGVTAHLDMLTNSRVFADARRAREDFAPSTSAALFSAGVLATVAGGHGTQFGVSLPLIDDNTDYDTWVRDRRAEGSDWIKLVIEPGAFGRRGLPTLSERQVKGLVAAAHRGGLIAVAHVSRLEDAKMAVRAGVDGLVHVWSDTLPDEAFLSTLRERGVFVVPTLSVLAGLAGVSPIDAEDPALVGRLSARQTRSLRARFGGGFGLGSTLYERVEAITQRLIAAGVTVLAGTDAANPGTAYGLSQWGEMHLLTQAGLSKLDALHAATRAPAARFGLADRGVLRVGARADLVLLTVESLDNLDFLAMPIAAVLRNGRPIALDPPTGVASTAERIKAESWLTLDSDDWRRHGLASTDELTNGAFNVSVEGSASVLRVRGATRPGLAFPWAAAPFIFELRLLEGR